MIIENQEIVVIWSSKNRVYYEENGYVHTRNGDSFKVSLNDLKPMSQVRIKAKCETCENIVVRSKSGLEKSKNHYCSKQCEVIHRKKIADSNQTIVICGICENEFGVPNGNKKNRRYCSKECADTYQRGEDAKAIRDLKSTKIKTECVHCEKDIVINPFRFKGHKKHYCSINCKGIATSGIKRKPTEMVLEEVKGLLSSKNCLYVHTEDLNKKKLINFTCNRHAGDGVQNRTWSNIVNIASPCKSCIKESNLETMKALSKIDIYVEVLNGVRPFFPSGYFKNLTDVELKEVLSYYRTLCEKDEITESQMIEQDIFSKYRLASLKSYFSKTKINELLFGDKYSVWELRICPPNFWSNPSNVEAARTWLIKKLISDNVIKTVDDIISLKSHKYFKAYGLDGLLYSKFNATVFNFWDELFKEKYKEWEYNQTKRGYWTSLENRISALKSLIEDKLSLSKLDIPQEFTYGFLNENYHKFSLICDAYYKSDLFKWIDEAYPNEFNREQFTSLIANDGTIVDSIAEKNIHNIFLDNNIKIKYVENKQDMDGSFINTDLNERYVPDWIIEENIIVEYYGWFMKDFVTRGNNTFISYNEKLIRKNEFYKKLDDYDFIDIYPFDIENNYKGLISKFKEKGIELVQ